MDPATIRPGTDFLADRTVPVGRLVMPPFAGGRDVALRNVRRIDVSSRLLGAPADIDPRYLTFVTLDGVRRHGWQQIPAGWLVESRRPLTSRQIADARSVAAQSGLTLEVRRRAPSFDTSLAIVMAAAALLALAILALTVGLIRGESSGDLRTLTATGASARVRRTLTATTAGALGLLGALLGVGGAYLVLVATYHDDLGYLSSVPVLYLPVALVGLPVAAGAAGWLLAGREPPVVARRVIE